MVNKRGISAVVATVLIILITVAAVTIIWSVIIPMIKDNINTGDYRTRLSIGTSGGYTFYDEVAHKLYVQVVRGSDDGDIVGMEIIVSTGGDSVTYSYNSTYVPQPNQAVMIIIGGITEMPDSVKVVPLVNVGGTIKVLGSSPTKIISSGTEGVSRDPTPYSGGPSPAPASVCDGTHLYLCDAGACSGAGGYWYSGTCNSEESCVISSLETAFNLPTSSSEGTIVTNEASWIDEDEIEDDDGYYAMVTLVDNNDESSDLLGRNFGFSIPAGSTIKGVEVQYNYSGNSSGCQTGDIYLVHSGSRIGDDGSSDYWDDYPRTEIYGGSTDTWGATLTEAIVESSTFGVDLTVENDGYNIIECYVHWVKMNVYYELCV